MHQTSYLVIWTNLGSQRIPRGKEPSGVWDTLLLRRAVADAKLHIGRPFWRNSTYVACRPRRPIHSKSVCTTTTSSPLTYRAENGAGAFSNIKFPVLLPGV